MAAIGVVIVVLLAGLVGLTVVLAAVVVVVSVVDGAVIIDEYDPGLVVSIGVEVVDDDGAIMGPWAGIEIAGTAVVDDVEGTGTFSLPGIVLEEE